MQRGHGLGLGRKYRRAFRGKLIGDAALGRRDHQRLSGLPRERRRVARERLDVIAGTGDGHADQESIGGGVLRDDREDIAEQPSIGQ